MVTITKASNRVVTTSSIYQAIHFPVSMRVPPTIGTFTFDGGTSATFTVNSTYGYTNAYQTANHSIPATVTSFPLSAEL